LADSVSDVWKEIIFKGLNMFRLRAFAPSWQIILLILSSCVQVKNDGKTFNVLPVDHPKPSWISETPLVFIGNWDAMPIFRRRVGGNPTWQEEAYLKENTGETVKKYKEMGVTMILLHFYKGFGLEAEKEHIEEARHMASICRQNGLKVGVYVGSTIGFETFLPEKPEAAGWFVPDYMGQPVLYGDQTFRKRVYFMHPGFIEYMKQVVKIAVEDLKVDLIHFDNTSMRAAPEIFQHPLAVQDFRSFLHKKYTPDLLKKRFGFSDVSYVEPPKYTEPMSTINDPLFQEWADFRCWQLSDFYGKMETYIHSLNPEVAVVNNPHSGLSGINTVWDQGIDYPRLLAHTDMVWTEEGNNPAVTEEGVLISKIRTYKMAETLNNRIFTYTSDSKLEMAEAMAYNRQGMGMVGGLKEMEGNQLAQGYEMPEDQKEYIRFFHRNFDLYNEISNIADIAVLHSFASMAFNNDLPYQSAYLYEQVLIQNRIPFDIIFDEQLKALSKYKVLILADQECLNDDKLGLIRSFVEQGGGLVATEFTSMYSEWRERKQDFGLSDLFKVNPPDWNGRSLQESVLSIPIQMNPAGKGRVVYVPEVKPSIPKPLTVAMTSRYWKLPSNQEQLTEAVKWASGNSLSVGIEAPLTVTMELVRKMDQSALILHLLNYDYRHAPVMNIKVEIEVPAGKRVNQVAVLTPDGRKDEILTFKEEANRSVFIVPRLDVYDMIVMKLK
jgi:hypothetical protein